MMAIVAVNNSNFYLGELMGNLIDAVELSQRLGVTVATIHAWHRRGWIPCLRAGRRPVLFDFEAVEKAMKERAQGGHN